MCRRLALVVAVLVFSVSGCGKKPPEFGQVQGVVRINGQPHRGIVVRFFPDPAKGNNLPINSTGRTDQQGNYTLKYASNDLEGAGAVVGWHRVLVEDSALSSVPQGQAPPPQLIPPAYNSPATTPLLKEVKSGSQTIDLDISK